MNTQQPVADCGHTEFDKTYDHTELAKTYEVQSSQPSKEYVCRRCGRVFWNLWLLLGDARKHRARILGRLSDGQPR